MRALIFNKVGAPEQKLKLADIEKPDINGDKLLVKVLGSSINPSDYMFIEGNYRNKPNFPQAAGLVGAGIVEESGSKTEIPAGTLVAFRSPGAWAEYISIAPKNLYVLSKDMPISQASQFALNPITAYALLESADIKPGNWVFLTAGNSSVAKLISQIAATKDINTISIVREKEESLLNNDQTFVVVWRNNEQDLLDQINKVTEYEGASALIDAVGGKMTSQHYSKV